MLSIGLSVFAFFISPYIVNSFFTEFTNSILPMQIMSISIIPLTILAIYESKFSGAEKGKNVLVGMIIQVVSYFILLWILGIAFADRSGLPWTDFCRDCERTDPPDESGSTDSCY